MTAQLAKAGTPGPQGDRHRRDLDSQRAHLPHRGERSDPTATDLVRRRGSLRSEHERSSTTGWARRRAAGIRLAVMDMWKPFRNATTTHAPQAAILFDKFHIMRHLGDALDQVRKAEYRAAQWQGPALHQGAEVHAALAPGESDTAKARQSLKVLLAANKRLNTAYLLKESFGQLWDYEREGWARRFFENWRASLKWQRLKPYEKFAAMIDRHWDGIAAYCQPENKVSLGFVEGLNNKIRVIQRRAYGLRDEEYLRLKILTCMLPAL